MIDTREYIANVQDGVCIIPPNISVIPSEHYANHPTLRRVIAYNLERIEESAFANCPELEEFICIRPVLIVERGAFLECNNLITVQDMLGPETVVDSTAFIRCAVPEIHVYNMEQLGVASTMPSLRVLHVHTSELCGYFSNLTHVHLDSTVRVIPPYTFHRCAPNLIINTRYVEEIHKYALPAYTNICLANIKRIHRSMLPSMVDILH